MLREYESLFGVAFWSHFVIVVTWVEDEEDFIEFMKANHEKDIQNELTEKFDNVSENISENIHVIPFGKKIYAKQLPLILAKTPPNKFACDALISPCETLKKEYDTKEEELRDTGIGRGQRENEKNRSKR